MPNDKELNNEKKISKVVNQIFSWTDENDDLTVKKALINNIRKHISKRTSDDCGIAIVCLYRADEVSLQNPLIIKDIFNCQSWDCFRNRLYILKDIYKDDELSMKIIDSIQENTIELLAYQNNKPIKRKIRRKQLKSLKNLGIF